MRRILRDDHGRDAIGRRQADWLGASAASGPLCRGPRSELPLCHHAAMAVAALVLSIVAILVAAVSAFYTRQQAAAAEGTRRIEAGRRHSELTPVLEAAYVDR